MGVCQPWEKPYGCARGGGAEQPPEGSNANRGRADGTRGDKVPKSEQPDPPSGLALEPIDWTNAQQHGRTHDLIGSSDSELRDTWAEWINDLHWNHVGHLTFLPTQLGLDLGFDRLRNWSCGLASVTQGPVDWVAFPEPSTWEPRHFHFHALLIGTNSLSTAEMKRRWQRHNGKQVRIERYDPARGIEYYITKMVSADFSEGDFSPGFQRRHHLAPLPESLLRSLRPRHRG